MNSTTHLPGYDVLAARLRRFGRFRRRWQVLGGLARFIIVGPGSLLLWFLVDWSVRLPAWLLLPSFVVVAALSLWTLCWWVLRPLLRRIDLEREALAVESLHGRLDNRLIGSLQLGRRVMEAGETERPLGYSTQLVSELVAGTADQLAGPSSTAPATCSSTTCIRARRPRPRSAWA